MHGAGQSSTTSQKIVVNRAPSFKKSNPPQSTFAVPQVLANDTLSTVITPDKIRKKSSHPGRYLSQCVVRVRHVTFLPVVCSSIVVDNEHQRIPANLWWPHNDYRRSFTAWVALRKWGLRSPTKRERNHNECFAVVKFSTCWKFADGRDWCFRSSAAADGFVSDNWR